MPRVIQLGVSLESKPGSLAKICSILGKAGINISALLAPEAAGRGKVRLIVDKLEDARRVLKENKLRFSEEQVLLINVEDRPGAFANIAEKLAKAKINIKYAYATTSSEKQPASVVVAVANTEKAMAALGGQ